jgi:hypothetical protein
MLDHHTRRTRPHHAHLSGTTSPPRPLAVLARRGSPPAPLAPCRFPCPPRRPTGATPSCTALRPAHLPRWAAGHLPAAAGPPHPQPDRACHDEVPLRAPSAGSASLPGYTLYESHPELRRTWAASYHCSAQRLHELRLLVPRRGRLAAPGAQAMHPHRHQSPCLCAPALMELPCVARGCRGDCRHRLPTESGDRAPGPLLAPPDGPFADSA